MDGDPQGRLFGGGGAAEPRTTWLGGAEILREKMCMIRMIGRSQTGAMGILLQRGDEEEEDGRLLQ